MVNSSKLEAKRIELRAIEIVRDGRTILDIPNTDIQLGGITACIGPNGAGKTTFLKLLHGLIKPNAGGSVDYANGIRSALVLHHTPMIKASVRTNIGLNGLRTPSNDEIDRVLQEVGISHLQHQPAHQLSAGEKQKLSLGRARLQNPNVLLLDEPTANLDPTTTAQVEAMIREFAASGCDILISSHQLAQVRRLADAILFIDGGQIIEKGACAPFFAQPQTEAAQRYMQRERAAD
jgi:tungstate transport system ATP-binding protein